jgi:hypothetical protein
MGVLGGFYAFSTLLVVFLGKETLYDRENNRVPTAGASKITLLTGVAGFNATGLPRMTDVFRHLFELLICPQLLLPCLFVCIQFMWAIGIGESILFLDRILLKSMGCFKISADINSSHNYHPIY